MARRVSPAAVAASLGAAAVLAFGAGAFLASRGDVAAPIPGPTETGATGGASPGGAAPTEAASGALTLATDQPAVAANAGFRLSGQVSPPAGGVAVAFERRLDGGDWAAFPVKTQTKGDGTFSTVVRSGRAGVNEFRAVATVAAGRLTSEPVTITIS